jgi:hypothetical protein
MQETATAQRERRYIYNGEPRHSTSGYALRPNRPGTQHHVSTFSIILTLFGLGIAIVLYINNILAVNQLAVEREQLSRRLQEIRNLNQELQSDISRKAALERIGTVASEKLGLRYPTEQAVLFDIDDAKLETIESAR